MSTQSVGNIPAPSAGSGSTTVAPKATAPTKEQFPAAGSEQARTDKPEPTSEQIELAVTELRNKVEMSTQSLKFSIDKETGKSVVTIVEKDSGTLIRQIPSEEFMEIARSIERMQGLLVNRKA